MANYENIRGKGFDSRSTEEQREIAKRGGINSGKARREKADLKKQLLVWMETTVAKDSKGKKITGAEYMVQVAVREMKKGNPKFWELIRDTAGFKPIDKVQIAEIDDEVMADVDRLVNEAEDVNKETSD